MEARKGQVDAYHSLEAFHVDARIPRLYIAHARMTHNETSPRVFRIRSLRILMSCAISFGSFCFLTVSARGTAGQTASMHMETGIDRLEAQHFVALHGKRVGLVTNQTGVDANGRRTIDVLAKAEGVKLVAIFSPEHGISASVDAVVTNA